MILRVTSTALHLACFSMSESQREHKTVNSEAHPENLQYPYAADYKMGWMAVDAVAATTGAWEHELF